jgi:hypothetical protein
MTEVKYLKVTPDGVVTDGVVHSGGDELLLALQNEVSGDIEEFPLTPDLVVLLQEMVQAPKLDQYNAYSTFTAMELARLRQVMFVFAGTAVFIGRSRPDWQSISDADAERVRTLVASVTKDVESQVSMRARANKLEVTGRE